jgi:uncharacterized membrane-anchored protein
MADRPFNPHQAVAPATGFDLNDSVRRWRENLSGSPALRVDDLDELESHLRDSISSLEGAGLSAREAFWVGTSRIGTTDGLDDEFAKVNVERVWLDRALWMVAGSLGILAASSLVSLFANLATVAIQLFTGRAAVVGPLGLSVYAVALGALFLMLWRAGSRGRGVAWRVASWMKAHPVAGATGVALFLALGSFSSTLTASLSARFMPLSTYGSVLQWRALSALLPVFFWPIVLGWLLERTAHSRS